MMSTQQKTDVNVIAVENNSWSNVALDDEGRVWTWGNDATAYRLGRDITAANPFNRGGQVTTTIYSGENLPFIIQISGSVQNTLVLDRDGNVWSWGVITSGALGRSGNYAYPGKVAFPAGVKIKWIAAALYGGKAIDTEGNIWVWGAGAQYGLGTGNALDVSTPVKLTLDSSNNPLPTNFVKISSSDYTDYAAAIAITEDGKIFTWGNNAAATRGGASRPKETGFNADVKKIDVGNGTYGFLTNSGELWTWGDNSYIAGPGRQGHGDSASRAVPKRVENVISGTTKPAPKFKDFSLYAWSMCAVDYEANIYGTGENLNDKHTGAGIPNVLTKYSPSGVPSDTQIFILAEGYSSTSYVDVYGNAYVTGAPEARGNNNSDGTPAGNWVHFTGSGKPMFTSLSSTPTGEGKRYNTSPKTTLNAETNVAANEIKYVIIYPDDASEYSDGETFYSKTFAELEQPYYNKDTDPQLLLSPNYDLWSSRYYANPKISQEVFEAAYNLKAAPEKGTMDVVASSGGKAFEKADLVPHNCVVWVQSSNASGTTRMVYRFDNYYTQTKVWMEGVKLDDPTFSLYQPELVGGGYGLFLDRHGEPIPGDPPFGYDVVKPTAKALDYWTLSPAGQMDEELAEDGYTHRVDRTKEVFLTDVSQEGDDATKTPRVTFSYEKDPDMWVDANLYFVDESGQEVEVTIDGETVTQEFRAMFAPKDAEFVEGQDPYLPPEAVNPLTKVAGYSVGTAPDGTADSYTKCSFPDGFRPVLNETSNIYIVYMAGMVSVTETFIDVSNSGETAIRNNDGLFSVVKNLQQGVDDYDYQGPAIAGYVIVGHEITVEGSSAAVTNYTWADGEYVPENAYIEAIGDNASVRFLYKADSNGNNIPDDEEGRVRAHWIAVSTGNSSYLITQKTFYGNGAQGDTAVVNEDKQTVLPEALYDPDKWLFRPGQPTDAEPYLPQGSGGSESVSYTAGVAEDVYFYYDEDYNENGVADKLEGLFTEKYKLTPSRGDLTPPRADTVSKWLGGQTYSKQAPLILNYVAVGYEIQADGEVAESIERVERSQTGDVSVVYEIPFEETAENYTVIFLYKEDANNNNIPDDEEGSVTVRWVGTTYAGNTVELEKKVIDGYIGDDVTNMIYPAYPIDSVWRLTSSDVPDPVILTAEAQDYSYQYSEAPEFSTITVQSVSADGTLDFYYQYTKRLIDEPFDVTAFAIPTYRVTDYVIYDGYGTQTGSGTGDTVEIDPSTGSQRIVFNYVSTITTVVVRAVDAEDPDNILQSQTITDAAIGQKYSATAPYVDNTWVLRGEVLQVIDVAEGTNYIIFEYEKAAGNVTVLLKETDTDGQIIRVLSETVTQGTEASIPIPDLSGAYYTQISVAEQMVDYTGADPVPQTVEYYYEKDMMDVTVVAIDEADGGELKSVLYEDAARKGESYTAAAPTVEWYSLTESESKSVYADPEAQDGTVAVEFLYKQDNVGDITVKSFYKDEDDNEVVLRQYTAKSLVGQKYTAIAGSIEGYELLSEDSVEIIVSEDSAENAISFEYADMRKTVGVFTQIDTDETTRRQISETKYVGGSEAVIIPPYMNDHLVVGYIIDEQEMVEVDPQSFTELVLSGDMAVTGDMSVVFVYNTIEEILENRYVEITVIGSSADGELYRYDVKRLKNSGDYEIEATDVEGYFLISETPVTIDVGDEDETVEFEYESVMTTVTVYMVDEATSKYLAIFTYPAQTGESFTCNAPKFVGYNLTSASEVGSVSQVLPRGASEITFTYRK